MEYLKNNPQRKQRLNLQERIIQNVLNWKANKYKLDNRFCLYLKYFIDKYYPNKKQNLTILDIGAADGWALSYKHPKISHKIIIDIDEFYKDKIEKKGIKFIKLNVDKENIPLENNSIDIVLMNHVLEHLKNPQLVIESILQKLKLGGILIIRVPDIEKNKFKFYNDFTHIKPYTKYSISKFLESNNYKIIDCINFNYNLFMGSFLLGKKLQRLLMKFGQDILVVGIKK